ncbi:hypothetical protein J1614_004779 [Plenodomus biglobosus]|nr:hypothetical protein J1614_004779 [Plenodomus biglobosus]
MRTSTLFSVLAATSATLAQPVRPPFPNITNTPTHFGLLVFPGFQALDVFGPMDVLNTVDMYYNNDTTMYLSVFAKTLAPVTTARQNLQGTVGTFGESIMPTRTMSDFLASGGRDDEKGDLEVLLVPGGFGAFVNTTEEINFIRAVFPKLRYILSVCTGATLLARAGVLDGRRATTNKSDWARATSMGPNTTWVSHARWVEDGNIFTSSGVAAGIDGTLAWVSRVYGDPVAEWTATDMEYERELNPDNDPFADIWGLPNNSPTAAQ